MIMEYNGGYEKIFRAAVSNHIPANNFLSHLRLTWITGHLGGNEMVLIG